MKKTLKKGLAYLLAVSMIITYMPATTFALEGVQADPGQVSLETTADGITVTAEAEVGVLPENANLDVSVLKDEDMTAYTEKVEADLEGEILNEPVAIEVKFVDGEGTEIQPEGDVDLTISNDAFEGKTEDLSVYFFEENEEATEEQYGNMDTVADGDTAIKVSTSVAGVFMVTDVQEKAADDDVIQSEAMDPVTSEPDAEEPVAEEPAKDVIPSEARDLDTSEVADGEGTTAEAEAPATPMDFAAQADNGVNVIVNAPAGAFPAGTTMEVKTVSTDEVIGAVSEAVDGCVKSVKAVDITFYNKEGKEIEPQLPISVKMFTTGMSKDSDKKVFHMAGEKAQPMADAKTTGVLTTASFESDAFSIYAIVETGTDARALVKFMNGNTEIKSMYVKENDDMKVVLYDPGAGELAEGVYFRGWTTEPNYTTKTKALTIEDVRTAVEGQLSPAKDGTEITYYAMLFKDYHITYLDENDISLGQEEVTFRADSTSDEQPYTVNMGYTVQDDTLHFEGWNVVDGGTSIVGHTDGKIYQNSDNINITGDITFGVNAPEGHWFIFDENGGGTYNAPQFIYSNDKPTRPNDSKMIRNGYTFGGWYADKATADQASGGMQYDFTQTLSDKTTVYARWIPKTTANYTVIIWKENINGDGYDFEESIPLSGTVGNTINTVSQQGTGNNAYARVNGVDKRYTGFRLKEFDQNVKIKTEGNSIVNVYYDRNEYTLTFQAQGVYTYTPTTSNSGTQYGLVDGEYVELSRHRGRDGSFYWTYNDGLFFEGPRYTGTRYTRSGGGNQWSTVKTITAKYGQSISDNFPIAGYENYVWTSQGSQTFGNRSIVTADIMPAENIIFHGQNSGTAFKMNYYLQPTSMSINHADYELVNSITAYGSTWVVTYEEDFMELSGFDRESSDPAFDASGNISHRGYGTMDVNFYYNRKTYPINFMDGKYVDGDDNPMEVSGMGQIGTKTGIGFNADVTSYNNYKPSTTPAGYVFEGWYVDDECTHPYTFNKMPEGGITVYAKWRQKEYRVFLHPNYPDNATGNIDWGTTGQKLVFRVSEGGHVSEPTGRLTGYEFVGWYFDEACTQVFNGEAYPINESNVTTPYDKTVDMTDTYDNNGNLIDPKSNSDATGYNGGDRFWITKKLDIYAKWRATLEGASGIVVEYDANKGTGAPTDTHTYVDGAKAPAGAASKSDTANKVFGHWIVQKWNGSAWEDTSDKVLPGDTFTVLASNAKVEDIENPQPGGDTKKYTVRLKAEYIDSEEPTPTHISWFENDGTEAYITSKPAVINVGVDIPVAPTREGYTFLGWARVATSTSNDYDTAGDEATAWEATPANWTQNLTASDLYLTYHEAAGETAAYYTIVDDTTVTQVAPDENLPYHAMFAVWRANPDQLDYDANGGSGTMDATEGYTGSVVTIVGNGFTAPAGMVFNGWNTADDGNGSSYGVGDDYTLTPGDDVLYAQWAPDETKTYTVEYTAVNGTITAPAGSKNEGIQVLGTEGVTGATASANPGYKFEGWYVGETKLEGAEAALTEALAKANVAKEENGLYKDTTFTVKFVADADKTYTVTYTAETGGSVNPTANEKIQVLSTDGVTGSTATADAGYTFDGWYKVIGTTETKLAEVEAEMTAEQAVANLNTAEGGVYADTTYKAKFTANDNTKYTVEYYYQENGAYPTTTETKAERSGTTDTTANVNDEDRIPTKEGYVFDSAAENVLSGKITGDGKLVLKVYFKQQFTVEYKKGDHGNLTEKTVNNLDYGAGTPAAPTDITADAGYKFNGWNPTVTETVSKTVAYIAQWIADDDQTYTVTYTTDGNGKVKIGEGEEAASQTNASIQVLGTEGVTGATASANPGYKFEGWYVGETKLEGAEAALAEALAKANVAKEENGLYKDTTFTAKFVADADKTYTVTYTAETGGSVNPTANEKIQVLSTEGVTGSTAKAADGYTFEGWYKGAEKIADATATLSAAQAVDNLNKDDDGLNANTTYTAKFTANDNTKYTVEYYYQENGAYPTTTETKAERSGTTDTTANVNDEDRIPTKEGYVFDSAAENVLSGKITGDGKLVLKVYFKQQFTVEYKKGDHGTFTETKHENLDYGTATPEAPETTGDAGYKFNGWDPAVTETVSKTVAYIAQWIADDSQTYTVTYESAGNGSVSPTSQTEQVLATAKITGSTATASSGYRFDGWYKGDTRISSEATLSAAVAVANLNKVAGVNANTTYTARFTSSGGGGGTPIDDPDVPLDLTTDHYAYVEGYEDGTVKPEGKITRAETATMIYRLLTVDRRDEVFTDQNNYSDVNKPDWYNKAVSSMTKGEYINGYPDGTFKANNSITRAEFVTILVRFLDGPRDGDLPFSDVKGHWAEQYITTAVQAGWIDGYPDGTFQPDKEISRAEAVKIINTVLHRGVNEHSELGDYINFPDNSDASKWYYYEIIEAVNSHEAENERPDENWISNKCEHEYDIDKYERP